MTTINAAEIVAAAKQMTVAEGEALYLVKGQIERGQDGCQPSNSLCLVAGPTDDTNWSEVEDAIEQYAADRA